MIGADRQTLELVSFLFDDISGLREMYQGNVTRRMGKLTHDWKYEAHGKCSIVELLGIHPEHGTEERQRQL